MFGHVGFFLAVRYDPRQYYESAGGAAIIPDNGGFHMLVLSRKHGESVVIGENDGIQCMLKVTVLDVRGRNVRLGFEVDASVPVHRLEVWERIQTNGGLDRGKNVPATPTT